MNKILNRATNFRQVRIVVFLLGLLWAGGQVNAQQATVVDIFREGFERTEFSDDYILPEPSGFNFYDFTYASTAIPDDNECIITKNANQNGFDQSVAGHSGSGYYLYAQKEDGRNTKKIYAVNVPVTKGEFITFGVFYCALNNGYNFEIQATGSGLGNTTITTGNLPSNETVWKPYSLTVKATSDGTITFSIVDREGYYESRHTFGIDDITISKKAIKITNPATLEIRKIPGGDVPLTATYNNPYQNGDSYTYEWQKYNGSSWTTATANTGAVTKTETGNSFTTAAFSVTESTEGFVNYRLVVTAGGETFYSDIITVEYTSNQYVFREDFGGNWVSTDWTSSSGASADWWIRTAYQPDITTDFTYGKPDDPTYDNRDKAEEAYGQAPIKLDESSAATYAITKLAGWKLPLPGYPGLEWKWGDGDGSGKGGFDDHTIPGDNSRGYFMYAANRTDAEKIVYEAVVPVTSDMLGRTFSFSAWQVAIWGRNDEFSYQFKLQVTDAAGTEIDAAEFGVSDNWEERNLFFAIPYNYTGSYITIRISSFGDNLWLGLDDISLTKYGSYVTITSPSSGSKVASNVELTVEYNYISSPIQYKWQESASDSGPWTDIPDQDGTVSGTSGTFWTILCSIQNSHYYRILITDGADTDFTKAINSDPVQLILDPGYLFKEDFGGTSQSTDLTKDWWISASQAQAAFLQQQYKSGYEYAPDADWLTAGDIGNHPHGMDKTLYLYSDRFAITKVSGYMADLEYIDGSPNPIMIADQKTMYDHTTGDGTGYYLMSRGKDNETIYSHTLSCLPAGNYAFNVWLASTSTDWANEAYITIQVTVGSGDTYKRTVLITNQDWTEYSVPFYTNGASVEISLISEGGYYGSATFGVDDLNITNLSPRITAPTEPEASIMEGTSATIYGEYKYVAILGQTVTYEWETSTNGTDWTKTGDSGSAPNIDKGKDAAVISPTHPTGVIDNSPIYYRLVVSGNGITLASEPVKITVTEWPKSKTYWVCPDKITEGEAIDRGYLPSLIYLKVEGGMYGIIYKWYKEEEDGSLTLLEDVDEYKNDQKATTGDDFEFESDGKTNTISVLNERNIDGIFKERTYWVEICDGEGNVIAGVDKIPIYLKQGYICGEPVPVISPVTARRLHRENFEGTAEDAPSPSPTPLSGMTYIHQTAFNASDGVEQGCYVVVKQLNGQGEEGSYGWYKGTKDHLYDIPDENPHGYFVAIDGSKNPGVFYSHTISNLGACRDVELVFSGWLASPMNWQGTDKASLKFTLTDAYTNDVLSEYNTGNLLDSDGHEEEGIQVATWRQYGFKFPVPSGIDAINLTITNNNFGTLGGNDILMDDIEIYLVIPPVKLVPAGDSFVCPDYTEVSLKGEYEDDGTLGNHLDYRWERTDDPVDGTWTVIPGQWGSVSTGMVTSTESEYFIEKFTSGHNGYYRLVVGQTGVFGADFMEMPNYDCVAISNPRGLTLIDESEKILKPSLEGLTAYCHDDVIKIVNKEQNPDVKEYAQYIWQLDGDILEKSPENYGGDIVTGIELNAADYAPGFHTLTLMVLNSVECSYYSIHQFVIYPEVTTWTANGDPKNWNDRNNWDNGVPGDCTDVIIPHKAMGISTGVELLNHYPLLIKPTVETLNGMNLGGSYLQDQKNLEQQKQHMNNDIFSLRPACDMIFFRMSGEVARTNYLKYNFAYVDLDIKPSRWYTISAPLRDMYSGDYFVEGNVKRMNPTVYMMKYNAINPQTQEEPAKLAGDFSNPFNTLTEELYPGLGYAVWVDDGDKTIEELQPFRFPKDDLQYEMWNYHGVSLGMTKAGLIKRGHNGRFTYEQLLPSSTSGVFDVEVGFDVEVKEDKSSYSTVLVGNPFMSHLDFSAFMAENPSLTGGYYIWTTGNTYEAIPPEGFSDIPDAIAPMQSFIVQKKNPASVISSLKFTFDMSITSPDPPNGITLRSLDTNKNILKMEVLRDNIVNSNIRIKYSPSSDNTYDGRKDMWTLFSKDNASPAVLYALLDGKAASIRTLGDLSEPIELGIRTDTWGPLTLRLSGMETFDSNYDLYLEDKLTQTMQNLREYPEYTFDNRTGNIQGRFFLRIGNPTTSVEDITSGTDIRIYEQNGKIIVNSSGDDPIETIKLYSVKGNLLYERQGIKLHSFSVKAPVSSQVIIVSVTTRTQKKDGKVMIR